MSERMGEYRSATGKELRKSPKGLIAGVLAAAIAITAALGCRQILNGMETLELESSEESELEVPELNSDTEIEEDLMEYRDALYPIEGIRHGALTLVNNDFPTMDIENGLVSVFENRNEYLGVRDMQVYLLEDAMKAVNQLAAGFYEATGHSDLLVRSGYITYEEQRKLYEADLQRTGGNSSELYAIPGGSEFESGYAFELALTSGDFTGEEDYEWVRKHCAEYGLIQRYPEEKSDITGISGNPWVFRYVGMPHSWYMYKNDLCMEEYADLLEMYPKEEEHFLLTDTRGRGFEVYYFPIDPSTRETMVKVPVPTDFDYTVSGNNKHGFFVTVSLE